jgi:hypothetical protein
MRCTSGCALLALVIAAVSVGAKDTPPAPAAPVAAEPTPPAAAKTTPPVDAAVERLIQDLGSEDYRTREKAGRDLVAKGEKVLPNLKAALAATDNPEVQRRLMVMVRKMDFDRLVSPKLVTMNLKDKTAKEALAEVAKQTGYKIDYNANRSSEPKQTFTFERATFWEVVDKIAGSAGCSVFNDFNDEGTIQIFNQDVLNPYVAYAGPFRILATNINSNRNLQLSGINRRHGGVNRQDFMNLNFQILSEPKNPMLGITHVDVVSATDDLGGTLSPPRDANYRANYYSNNGYMRGHNMYGNMGLSRAEKTATTIKTLKAKAGVMLLSGTVPEIVVSDPLKVKNKTFTGRSVEIEFGTFTEDANSKGHYSLELTAKKLGPTDPNRGEDFNWMNSVWQKIEVTDANGARYQTNGPSNFNNNGSTVQLTLQFGPQDRRTGQTIKLAPPTKVLVNEWLSVVHEITFEFKDIPLP